MANVLYPLWKQDLLNTTNAAEASLSTTTVKVVLVDTGSYTYSATHQFLSQVTGMPTTSANTLASKTIVNGVFDAADLTLSATAGVSTTYEALVIYIDTGVAGTSRLVAYIDSGIGNMPATVSTTATNVAITWNAAGIFAL